MKDKFMEFIRKMDMSYSYKPVLVLAMFKFIDDDAQVCVDDIVDFVKNFYEGRIENGFIAEKSNSIYQKGGYTDNDVQKNIFSNPFKRFSDINFMKRCKDVEYIELNRNIFKNLTDMDRDEIVEICNDKIEKYYSRLK